jgi:ketosteroid isomerase-like protein
MTISGLDRAALTDLVHRYAADIDDRRFDSVADLFTEDAELTLPDPPTTLKPVRQHCGRAAIRDAAATVAATIRTQHAVVGEVYDAGPLPGTARGRIACVAHHWIQHGDQVRDVTWHLRYDDEYRCVETQWRIRSRILTIDAIDNRPVRQVRRGSSG